MKVRTFRVAGIVLVLLSISSQGRTAERGPVLALSWHDANDRFPLPFGPVAKEIETAFERVGVEVVWEQSSEATRHLRVLLLPVEPTVWKLPPNAMGATLGDVSVRNTVYVFLPTVMRALGLNLSTKRLPTLREKLRIARALGRVVSHELFHALLFDQPHAENGLMREQLHAGALDHPVAHFGDESADALRTVFFGR